MCVQTVCVYGAALQLQRALPSPLLQISVKLTKAYDGLMARLRYACGPFSKVIVESCAKQAQFKSILFALSYFHAVLLEHKQLCVANLPAATSGRASHHALTIGVYMNGRRGFGRRRWGLTVSVL